MRVQLGWPRPLPMPAPPRLWRACAADGVGLPDVPRCPCAVCPVLRVQSQRVKSGANRMTRADLFTAAIIASGRDVTQSDLDRALQMGRWMADQVKEAPKIEHDARDVLTVKLVEALRSIAANTCCEPCQEAALVARAALAEYEARG